MSRKKNENSSGLLWPRAHRDLSMYRAHCCHTPVTLAILTRCITQSSRLPTAPISCARPAIRIRSRAKNTPPASARCARALTIRKSVEETARTSRSSDAVNERVDLSLGLTPDLFGERVVAGDGVMIVERIGPVRVRRQAQLSGHLDHLQDQRKGIAPQRDQLMRGVRSINPSAPTVTI